jgi:hypothetical protein
MDYGQRSSRVTIRVAPIPPKLLSLNSLETELDCNIVCRVLGTVGACRTSAQRKFDCCSYIPFRKFDGYRVCCGTSSGISREPLALLDSVFVSGLFRLNSSICRLSATVVTSSDDLRVSECFSACQTQTFGLAFRYVLQCRFLHFYPSFNRNSYSHERYLVGDDIHENVFPMHKR